MAQPGWTDLAFEMLILNWATLTSCCNAPRDHLQMYVIECGAGLNCGMEEEWFVLIQTDPNTIERILRNNVSQSNKRIPCCWCVASSASTMHGQPHIDFYT